MDNEINQWKSGWRRKQIYVGGLAPHGPIGTIALGVTNIFNATKYVSTYSISKLFNTSLNERIFHIPVSSVAVPYNNNEFIFKTKKSLSSKSIKGNISS